MSTENFKPTIWAGMLLKNLNDEHVYGALLNRDYEGEISEVGNSVKINSIGRITITDYIPNSDHATPEVLDESQVMLAITQAKMFNFLVDDVDNAQTKPKLMRDAMQEAAWGLSDVADVYLAALLEAGVQSANQLSAATVGTGASDADAYEILIDLGVALSDQNVPKGGRWCVIPPWYEGMLLKDPRFVSFGTQGNVDRLKNGQIGRGAGFTIAVSNNVPVAGSVYTVIAGYKGAATFAQQISKVESFRPERRFADAVKGLDLYGAKVTRPYGLAYCKATQA